MYNGAKTTHAFLRNVTHVAIKNDNRLFDGSVPYYLSRDYFHAYVSPQLSSGSIWYAPSCLMLTHHVNPAIVFELALRIYLCPMYLLFYASCHFTQVYVSLVFDPFATQITFSFVFTTFATQVFYAKNLSDCARFVLLSLHSISHAKI